MHQDEAGILRMDKGKTTIEFIEERSLSINSQEIKKLGEAGLDQNSERSLALDLANIGPNKKL